MEIATACIATPILPFRQGSDQRFRRAALGVYPEDVRRRVDILVLHNTVGWQNRASSHELEDMFPDHRVLSCEQPDKSFAVTYLVHQSWRTIDKGVNYDKNGVPVVWLKLCMGIASVCVYAPKTGFGGVFDDDQYVVCRATGDTPQKRLTVATPASTELTHTEYTTAVPHGSAVAGRHLFHTSLAYDLAVGPNALIAA